jgi:hypothetical protein
MSSALQKKSCSKVKMGWYRPVTLKDAISSGGYRKLSLPDPLRDNDGRDELGLNGKGDPELRNL